MKTLLLIFGALVLPLGLYAAEVEVSAVAGGEPQVARELALAQALREAVRQGVGVDVLSESKVQNFELEYDRVMTSSFGYVENYEVMAQSYDAAKREYHVTLRATVSKGRPQMDDVMALRLLIKRVKSPRVMVESEESFSGDGVSAAMGISTAVLEELAQKNGFEIFRMATIASRDHRDAARAELLGDQLDAKVKKAGIASTSDFKIIATVKGTVGSLREPFPEVKVRDASLGVDLQAVWTDTGEVAATVSIPTTFFKGEAQMALPFEMPEQLLRHYLTGMLTGTESAGQAVNANELFRRIIAKWIVELDLGAKIQLELKQIDKESLDKLVAALEKHSAIGYVWRREFDRRLFSVVEVETRLSAEQLADEALKVLGGKYMVDVQTKRRVRLVPEP
jgi:hypothetical protein